MALNHDIAAMRLDNETGRDPTAGLTVIALLLALVLGMSAVDIHRGAPAVSSADGLEQTQTVLDGRGKWAGYL